VVFLGQFVGPSSHLDVSLTSVLQQLGGRSANGGATCRRQGTLTARLFQAEQSSGSGDGQRLGSGRRRRRLQQLVIVIAVVDAAAVRAVSLLVAGIFTEDELAIADQVLGDNGLHAHPLQSGHASDLDRLGPEEVRRPHDGHVLGSHSRLVATKRHTVQMP